MPETINGIMGNVLQNSTQSTTINPTSPNIRTTSDFRFYEDAGTAKIVADKEGYIPKTTPKSTTIYWVVGVLLVAAVGAGIYFFIIKKK